jgi:hypothetical protein
MPTITNFGVCGSSGFGDSGVQLIIGGVSDVDFGLNCELPFFTAFLTPNSTALLDFSQPSNSQYVVPLMF